jgi:hypothetical protein
MCALFGCSVLGQTAPYETPELRGEPREVGPQESSFDINDWWCDKDEAREKDSAARSACSALVCDVPLAVNGCNACT